MTGDSFKKLLNWAVLTLCSASLVVGSPASPVEPVSAYGLGPRGQPRPVACAGSQLLDLNGLLDHLVGGVGMFAF